MRWISEGDYWIWDVHPAVRAWVSTRRGGVSQRPWQERNLSLSVGDAVAAVLENRQRTLSDLGRSLDELVMAEQVHKGQVDVVDKRDQGKGARSPQGAIAGSDGLVTQDADVVLGMGFADCVPVFLADKSGGTVGVVHAGWRGTVASIASQAVSMFTRLGVSSKDILCAIGPSIGPCCYEVDAPVEQAVRQTVGGEPLTPAGSGHWMLDLWLANQQILERAGILPGHIARSDLCTSCHTDQFFSYRKEQGKTGRMGGYICINRF